jgi:hypothetical protein
VWNENGFEELPASPAKLVSFSALRSALLTLDLVMLLQFAGGIAVLVYVNKSYCILLPLVVLLIIYLAVRFCWQNDLWNLKKYPGINTVHHGVIFLSAMIIFLLLLTVFYQIYCLRALSNSECHIYFVIESISVAGVILLAALSGRIEKKVLVNQ